MRDEGFVTDACDIPPGTWLRNDVQGLEEAYLWAAQNRGWPSWYEPPRETEFGLRGTWSNREIAPPLTLERLRENFRRFTELADRCEPPTVPDNVTDELMALVRQGDEAGFRELAACVMPVGEIAECWAGARARVGLADPPLPSPCQEPPLVVEGLGTIPRPGLPFYGRSITEMLWEYIHPEETR